MPENPQNENASLLGKLKKSRFYPRARFEDPFHFKRAVAMLKPQCGQSLLEVGADRGKMVKKFRDSGIEAQGVDINEKAVELANSPYMSCQDAANLQFADSTFDLVLSIHTIEHVVDVGKVFAELRRVTKPGGKIAFIYPAEPIRGLYAIPIAIAVFKNPFKAREIHRHKLTNKSMERYGTEVGFSCLQKSFWLLTHPQFGICFEKPH